VELPLQLDRAESPIGPADAFLLTSDDSPSLASACVSLAGAELPEVHRVRGGFLLIPRESPAQAPPGAIRLRRLAGDLYLPVDARLRPALLADEIVALTALQGLVALPGGVVLAFDPSLPLPVQEWLRPPRIERSAWTTFPERPERPEKLLAVEQPLPPAALMELLSPGAPDDTQRLDETGTSSGGAAPDDARPPTGSALGRLMGGVGLGAGGFLVWLGRQVGAPGLARWGADLARRAIENIPRLTEQVLGQQEAALREVLRQLQSGDIERALRRAPIAVADPDRPSQVAADARLGTRDPRYSLRDLIGGGGAARTWLGGGDVWNDLAREYRRLAQEALARGDYRRAAYLHGVLLRDLRSAANALMAGGLFRDAALLFRDRLKDLTAAADAFERAGDHDEALRLYEHSEHFEQAAELLSRLGETERALGYYLRAAEQLAGRGRWLAAGDLLRKKAGEHEHANSYYRLGWQSASAEAEPCGERLLDAYLIAADVSAATALFDEAERTLALRTPDAGRFFNYAIRVSEAFLTDELRGDLIDRSRLLFAQQLQSATGRADDLASELFGQRAPWPAPVMRDAQFAIRSARQRPGDAPLATIGAPVQVVEGTVAAIAVARGSFDVFIATDSNVVSWRPGDGRIATVCNTLQQQVVRAISSDRQAKTVYLLCYNYVGDMFMLHCFNANRSGEFSAIGSAHIDAYGEQYVHLQDTVEFRDGDYRIATATESGRYTYQGWYLKNIPLQSFPSSKDRTFLLVESDGGWLWDWHGGFLHFRSPTNAEWEGMPACWTPGAQDGNPRKDPCVDWLTPAAGLIEVTGVDREGALYWTGLDVRDAVNRKSKTAAKSHNAGYLAACLLAPGVVAAATNTNEIHWFRVSGSKFIGLGVAALNALVRVFALVAHPPSREAIAIMTDGSAIRLKQPGRV
jgi:tetratricopeptide (TPR) repeat protein